MAANTPTTLIFRAPGGAAGSPASLYSAQLAYNMADGLFYVGFGDDGGGNATSIKVVAADDFVGNVPAGGSAGQALVKASGADGDWTWGTVASGGGTYTASGDGIELTGSNFALNYGEIAVGLSLSSYAPLASPALTGTPTAPTQTAGNSSTRIATTAFVQGALAGKADASALSAYAPLASPTLTGAPTAPTAAQGTNNTQLATTGFVRAEINALLNGAGAAYDTFFELQQLLEGNASSITAITTSLGNKLDRGQNLADLTDAAAARGNLGLGTMATQAASGVAITGGTISGATISNTVIRGGTF